MSNNYWSRVLNKRIGRRRAILASSTWAVAGSLALACGSNDKGQTDSSGLLSKPEDTTAKAVPGGVWQDQVDGDVVGLDVNLNISSTSFGQMSPTYEHLMKYSLGHGNPINGAVVGEVAESFEFSPDGLTLIMRLRQNHKWDWRPPTSGRAMTTADVKFSWDRTIAKSPFAADVYAGLSPSAPVASLTTPDDKTIVLKLAYPYRSILEILAHNTYFYIMPQEADGKFDPKSEARGSGPFFLDKWTPSLAFDFKKNPDWYEKGRPFLDGIHRTIIPDYSAALAQFEAGNIWTLAVRQEDILRVKRAHPSMVLRPTYEDGGGHYLVFSQQPDSPLRDARVRRAASMLIDRDAWIAAIYNSDAFEKAGLPVDVRWNSHISAGFPEWLDPRGKEIGEGGKFFQHSPEEAKRLLAAAGYDRSKTTLSHFYQTNTLVYIPRNETLDGMLAEAFNLDFRVLDYLTEWRQVCQQSAGKAFNGFCYNTSSGFNAENYATSVYTPEGKFRMSSEPIQGITDLARQIKTEIDANKQADMLKELQRRTAMEMPNIHMPGYTSPFQLSWRWLENVGAFSNTLPSARTYAYYWYDKSKQTS